MNNEEIKVFIQWYDGPFGSTTKASKIMVHFFSKGRPYSLPAEKELVFDASMPSMGHGLDNPGFFQERVHGFYDNSQIRFQMTGFWMMRLLIIDHQNFEKEPEDILEWESLL